MGNILFFTSYFIHRILILYYFTLQVPGYEDDYPYKYGYNTANVKYPV